MYICLIKISYCTTLAITRMCVCISTKLSHDSLNSICTTIILFNRWPTRTLHFRTHKIHKDTDRTYYTNNDKNVLEIYFDCIKFAHLWKTILDEANFPCYRRVNFGHTRPFHLKMLHFKLIEKPRYPHIGVLVFSS